MRSTKSLVVLLLVLVVGGGANYYRNAQKDAQVFRPYRSYSEADLEALLGAYREDADRLVQRYTTTKEEGLGGHRGTLLDERVAQFERAQARAQRVRDAGAALSMREADIQAMQRELQLKAQDRDRLGTFLRRVGTF